MQIQRIENICTEESGRDTVFCVFTFRLLLLLLLYEPPETLAPNNIWLARALCRWNHLRRPPIVTSSTTMFNHARCKVDVSASLRISNRRLRHALKTLHLFDRLVGCCSSPKHSQWCIVCSLIWYKLACRFGSLEVGRRSLNVTHNICDWWTSTTRIEWKIEQSDFCLATKEHGKKRYKAISASA